MHTQPPCVTLLAGRNMSSEHTLVVMCKYIQTRAEKDTKMACRHLWQTSFTRKASSQELTTVNQAPEVTYCRNIISGPWYLEIIFIKWNATLKTKCKIESTREDSCYFSVQEPPPSCHLSHLQKEGKEHTCHVFLWHLEVLHIWKRIKYNPIHLSLFRYCLCWNVSWKSIPFRG